MKDFKEKLYNYEAEPPVSIWDKINNELQAQAGSQKVISMPAVRKKSKLIFYGLTAAASLIIIFISTLFFNSSKKKQITDLASVNQLQNLLPKQVQDSLNLNNKILKDIINSPEDKNVLVMNYANTSGKEKKYITIAGPECEPVKISPKVATLIESADNEYPPKPVWNKKIEKWKQIMLTTTLSPTSTSLLDIVQTSSNTIDNSE